MHHRRCSTGIYRPLTESNHEELKFKIPVSLFEVHLESIPTKLFISEYGANALIVCSYGSLQYK